MYSKARDAYVAMADEQEAALMQNIRSAGKIALKRAKREHKREMERISMSGGAAGVACAAGSSSVVSRACAGVQSAAADVKSFSSLPLLLPLP